MTHPNTDNIFIRYSLNRALMFFAFEKTRFSVARIILRIMKPITRIIIPDKRLLKKSEKPAVFQNCNVPMMPELLDASDAKAKYDNIFLPPKE